MAFGGLWFGCIWVRSLELTATGAQ